MDLLGKSDPDGSDGYVPGAWDEVRAAFMDGHISEEAYEVLRAHRWVPVDKETAESVVGEGVHTGFRKAAQGPKASQMWNLIHEDLQSWSDAVSFFVWGLDVMGLAICEKPKTEEKESKA